MLGDGGSSTIGLCLIISIFDIKKTKNKNKKME